MLEYIWQYLYTSFFRFWLKWILRQVTGKCELQRICSGYKQGAPRTSRAEYSLESSKSKALRAAVDVEEDKVEKCVAAIMKEKSIHSQKDPTFKANIQVCIFQITGYKKLYFSVENLRKQVFDSENKEHEDMLLKLWNLLMPTVQLQSRITKQWGDIGFQGDDPKTDFRGMGMLGLTNLIFFGEKYTEVSRQVLSHSNHPKLGYSYAIVGINLTEMAYSLLKTGTLKPHFYNSVPGVPRMEHFHELYCYLAYEFDKFWMEEEPASIMEFNQYREKFQEKVKKLLEQPDVSLSLRVSSKQ